MVMVCCPLRVQRGVQRENAVWRSRMVRVGGNGIPLMVCLWGRVVMVFLRIPLALPLPAPFRPAPVERGGRSPYGK